MNRRKFLTMLGCLPIGSYVTIPPSNKLITRIVVGEYGESNQYGMVIRDAKENQILPNGKDITIDWEPSADKIFK